MPIIIASENVQNLGVNLSGGNDLSRKDVRKCGHTAAKMGVTVGGAQEIAEESDRVDLRAGLGPNYEVLVHGTPVVELALFYDTRDLTYIDGSLHAELLSHGEAKLEPNRYYLKARFTRNHRPRLAPFAVGTTHLISKPWSRGHVPDRAHRQELWNHQWDLIGRDQRAEVADGVTVFGTGDLNRAHALPPVAPGMRVLGHNGLDYVWVVEGPEVGFEFMSQQTKNDPSDHDVLGVQGSLVNLA